MPTLCRYPKNVDSLAAEDVKGISRLVEHPVPIYPPGEATEAKELPIYLTADVSVCVGGRGTILQLVNFPMQ